jgi:hypothetical protein
MGVLLFAWRNGNPRQSRRYQAIFAPPLGLTVEYGDNVTGDFTVMLTVTRERTRVRTPSRLACILALPPAAAARRLRFARSVGGRFS